MSTPTSAPTRNHTIDCARGLGMILVVAGHSPLNEFGDDSWSALVHAVYAFHMPLFFFMSGLFLRPETPLARQLRQRASSLLKPYVVVLSIYSLLWVLAAGADHDHLIQGLSLAALGIAYGTGQTIKSQPLWFLPHLFAATLAAALASRALSHTPHPRWATALLMAASLAAGATLLEARPVWQHLATHPAWNPAQLWGQTLLGWPWSADLLLLTVPWLLAGHLCSPALQSWPLQPSWRLGGAAAVFIAMQMVFDGAYIDFNARHHGPLLLCLLQAALGIYVTLAIAQHCTRFAGLDRALCAIGSASIIVLLFHGTLQKQSYNLLSRLMPPAVAGVLAIAAGVILPLGIARLAKNTPLIARLLLPART